MLQLKQNILKNRPYILCKKLNFETGNKKKTDRINRSCDNKTDKTDRISKNDEKTNTNNIIFSGKYT